MAKKIVFGKVARKSLKVGVDAVGNSVSPTMGPRGRNVVYDKGYGGPVITNDGVSIAQEVIMKDPIENMGANIIKDVATKTNDSAGDGTTTASVLMQAIVSEGMKELEISSWESFLRLLSFKPIRVNAIGMKNGIEKASKIAVSYLKSIAKPIKSDEEITQVAVISSESPEIGKLISETIGKLGSDAVITVEESPTVGIFSETSQGMEFEKGYISPYMVTDKDRMEAEFRDARILVTDMKLGPVEEILPLLEQIMASGKRELVIIADDIVGEALTTFIVNKARGALSVLGIKAPGFGNRKKDYLEDIAAMVGTTVVSSETGGKLSEVRLENLGSADRVVSVKDKTTIVGGRGSKEQVAERVAMARKELEGLESKHDQIKVEERIARLSGGVAIIKVGAATETESKYLKLKVEDAVNAVKAALEEGIVAGGGSALIRAAKAVLDAKNNDSLTKDELLGFDILAKAMEMPLRNIAINCGLGDGNDVVNNVKKMDSLNGGFDALKNEYVDDMLVAGIVDPVKVARSAIENASSAGGTLLTMECAMAEEPKIVPGQM